MADARAKAVAPFFIDNWFTRDRFHSALRDLGSINRYGDIIDIPYQAAPTNASPTSRAAAQSLLPSIYTLTADQEAFYNIAIPRLEAQQLVNGSWPMLTGEMAAEHMLNVIDLNLITYFNLTTCWTTGTANTYHDNVGSDSLTDNDMANAEAAMLAVNGVRRENLRWFFHPYGAASVRAIADYVPGFTGSEQGRLGIPTIGSVNGIPVSINNQILNSRTVATTQVVVASNVATATVAAGHGIVAGMMITTSGHTVNASTAVAVTSTTATTVVYPLTTGDATLADGTGTITVQSCENMLVDMANTFVAKQEMPNIRVVEDYESANSAIQFYSLFGRVGIPGRVRIMHSPATSA